MDIEEFLGGLSGVSRTAEGIRARCPAHEDSSPSLMVKEGFAGKLLIKCHAGCDTADVLKAMDLTWADVSPAQHVVAEYPYTDTQGQTLYTVVRYGPKKDFRCMPKLPGEPDRVVFGLPEVKAARDAGTPVWFCEGEKDALSLRAHGHVGTTIATGAKARWSPAFSGQLAGCHLRIVADDDRPGHEHALRVAREMTGKAASIEMYLPASGCKDITEHLELGHGLDALREFATETVHVPGKFLHEMTVETIAWAWYPYFPLGCFCLVEGDPGCGKSTVVGGDLAARFSSGKPMPDGSVNPWPRGARVLVFSAEDDPAATVLPRLLAAGANPRNVKICGGLLDDGHGEPFDLSGDGLDRLRAEIRQHGAKVVIIDPLMAFLPEGTDSISDHSVRRTLGPVAKLAHDEGVLILFVRHLNKGTGKALYRGGGSIAFTGAARGAYLVAKHPDDETMRVFSTQKMNLAAEGPSLSYRVIPDTTYNVGKVEWLGVLDMGSQEVLDGPSTDGPRTDYLDVMVSACTDGPRTWAEIKAVLNQAGLNDRTAERHRHKVLSKVPGLNGNRDVAWVVKGSQAPLRTTKDSSPQSHSHPLTSHSAHSAHSAKIYIDRERGEGGVIDPDVAEYERDRAMEAKPRVCEECGATPAMAWGKPYWKVACRAHAPMRGLFAL